MKLTVETIAKIAGVMTNDNMASVLYGLQMGGVGAGLERLQRLAHYLGQSAHESSNFRYDREIWGPTAAQKRYEGRKDLGNIYPGDGKLFAGHGPFQVTGRANHREFTAWCRKLVPNCPDFEKNPELINTDPWEGLTGIWYWSTRELNRWADVNDIDEVTRRINGGYNGLADRKVKYDRAALTLLGFEPTDIRGFQASAGIGVDGISGPATRIALHKALGAAPLATFGDEMPGYPQEGGVGAPAPIFRGLLRYGDEGSDVAALQRRFGLAETGMFDLTLKAAVRGFQLGAGLGVDGIAGPKTFAALGRA